MQMPMRWIMACAIVSVVALWGVCGVGVLSAQEAKPLEPKDGLVCLLVNKNSGRCLSVANQAVDSGARIVQGPTPDQAGASEHWTLLGADNAFRLRNEHSGLVLQIWSSNLQPGAQPVQAPDQVTKEHQHWTFEPIGNAFLLRAGHSQLILGVAESARKEGARVIQWKYVPGVQDQLWLLRSTEPGAALDPGDDLPKPAPEEGIGRWRGGRALTVVLGLVVTVSLVVVLRLWLFLRHRRRSRQQQEAGAVEEGQGE
jgi:hypothetical protein